MHELDFAADQSLQKAWKDIQWNFSEDLEKQLAAEISHSQSI